MPYYCCFWALCILTSACSCLDCGSVVCLEASSVLGQNGSGQNGMDKMVWTKWYTDKMISDKMVWTKWYRQNGTDKIL